METIFTLKFDENNVYFKIWWRQCLLQNLMETMFTSKFDEYNVYSKIWWRQYLLQNLMETMFTLKFDGNHVYFKNLMETMFTSKIWWKQCLIQNLTQAAFAWTFFKFGAQIFTVKFDGPQTMLFVLWFKQCPYYILTRCRLSKERRCIPDVII